MNDTRTVKMYQYQYHPSDREISDMDEIEVIVQTMKSLFGEDNVELGDNELLVYSMTELSLRSLYLSGHVRRELKTKKMTWGTDQPVTYNYVLECTDKITGQSYEVRFRSMKADGELSAAIQTLQDEGKLPHRNLCSHWECMSEF